MSEITGTFSNENVVIHQYKYPQDLCQKEVSIHQESLNEYREEVLETLLDTMEEAIPNVKLYENQPYITSVVRHKLIDFLLRMAVRLKIVPYVFCKAVRLFDRYCAKRIVLLDQAQLVMTTCLWIAAKVHGGNNHFANLSTPKAAAVKTILNLGYGAGARFLGPTERYRLPKINELVKLCGTRCNYDAGMFRQMELHIMLTLEWKLNDASIDDFLVHSDDLNLFGPLSHSENLMGGPIARTKTTSSDSSGGSSSFDGGSFTTGSSCGSDSVPSPTAAHDLSAELADMGKIKEFIAYAACYLFDLVRYTPLQLAQMSVNLINDVFHLDNEDPAFVTLNQSLVDEQSVLVDFRQAREIRRHLMRAIFSAPAYLLRCFDTPGPRFVYSQVTKTLRLQTAGSLHSPLSAEFPTGVSSGTGALSHTLHQPLLSGTLGTVAHHQPLSHANPHSANSAHPHPRFPHSLATLSPSLSMAMNNYTYAPPDKASVYAGLVPNGTLHGSGLQDQLRTPVRDTAASANSHLYPSAQSLSLHPPPCKSLYMRTNSSLGSVGSNGSSKLDLFHDSAKFSLATPMSIDDDRVRTKKKYFC